jgi:hypothetical protein
MRVKRGFLLCLLINALATIETADSRVHLQSRDLGIPGDRAGPAQNDHAKTGISKDDPAKTEGNQPPKWGSMPAGTEWNVEGWAVYNQDTQSGTSEDTTECLPVAESIHAEWEW